MSSKSAQPEKAAAKAKRSDLPSWRALAQHHSAIKDMHITDFFAHDPARFKNFHAVLDGFIYDYSKTLMNAQTKADLINLAKDCALDKERDALFGGEKINLTEDRAALHTALRAQNKTGITIDGEDVDAFVQDTKAQIKTISDAIRRDTKIKHLVNIGIGGSDLGPYMACEALKPFANGPQTHFVSNIDGAHITHVLENCKAEETVFIIASKTFTTLETLTNAQTAKNWIIAALGESAVKEHFIAVSSNTDAAIDFGIAQDRILPLRDWIGGRYSVWSSIGLPIAVACGYDVFEDFLSGAHAMDEHFKIAPFEKNIPVLMALIGVWHRNFCDYNTVATLPYAQNLERFPQYIQQVEMESNGKSVDRQGRPLNHQTNTILFGEPGTNAQHAFFQLLHQGTEIVPCDFIIVAKAEHNLDNHHKHLVSNALAQSAALMKGHLNEGEPHKNFPGNRPSTTLILPRLNAYYLGMLMALYEHKTFVQGCIWDINSFDQWGVELGKDIAKTITAEFDQDQTGSTLDSSTAGLLKHLKSL